MAIQGHATTAIILFSGYMQMNVVQVVAMKAIPLNRITGAATRATKAILVKQLIEKPKEGLNEAN